MAESGTAAGQALLTAELERFVQIVASTLQPEQILLFGSMARSEIEECTDLDFVVIAETDLPFYERTRQILNSVSPKVGMDIIVYTPAEWEELKHDRPFVRDEMVGSGRVIYERGG